MNNLKRRMIFQYGADYSIYIGSDFNGYVKPHSHDFYQCMLVFEGHVREHQNGQQFDQYPGYLFFTPKNTTHALDVYGLETKYYCLSFSQNMAINIFSRFQMLQPSSLISEPLIHLSDEDMAFIIELCDFLIKEQDKESRSSMNVGGLITETILTIAFRSKFLPTNSEKDGTKKQSAEDVIRNVMDYIDLHYNENITIDKLVEISKLSRTVLSTAFPKVSGMTIKNYITDKRIHEAIKITYQTDTSWARIAEEVGYNDFSTFYRNFVKVTGVSPNEYHKQSEASDFADWKK